MKFKKILSTSLLCALMCTNFASNKINAEELNTVSTPFSVLANIDLINISNSEQYSLVSENESLLPEEVKTLKVFTTEDLKLRKSTDDESEVIKVIPKGTEVTVTFGGDKWSDITFEGEEGVASTDYLEKKEVVDTVEKKENNTNSEKEDTVSKVLELVATQNNRSILKPNNILVNLYNTKPIYNTVVKEVSNEKTEVKETPKSEPVKEKPVVKETPKPQPFKEEVKETPKPQPKVEYKTVSLYTTENLNARSSKSTSASIITVISKGTYLTGKDHGDWLEITVNGRTAYVMKAYLSTQKPKVEVVKKPEQPKEAPKQNLPTPNQSAVETMVQAALSQVGKPYVYASSNPAVGFDCSGLTYYAFGKVGVYLSRSAASQFGYGTPIPKSDIKRGDLLFFSNGSRIGHVGIYLGNGKMVHASTYDTGVIVSNIGIGYYINNYAGARRILK